MVRIVRNEKGVALVVTLVMLVLLTILGTYALSTSSTELFISGNFRNNQYAFYGADSGIEYGKHVVMDTRNVIPGNSLSPDACWPKPSLGKTCQDEKQFKEITVGTNEKVLVNVTWMRTGAAPPGYADDDYVADYYVITSVGSGPDGTNAQVRLESMVINIRNTGSS